MGYECKIIADSLSEAGARLTTMQVTLPRAALSEFNTHRDFSRNSASSRAIPIEKTIKRIMDDPYIPIFDKDQKGMTPIDASEDSDYQEKQKVRVLKMRDLAIEMVLEMSEEDVSKGDANRYLEPYMWQTIVVTATRWSNALYQRLDKNAWRPMRTAFGMVKDCLDDGVPVLHMRDDPHLPYIDEEERISQGDFPCCMIAVARCARVSYLQQDGTRDLRKDYKLYDRLTTGGHWSPFEHVAFPALTASYQSGNFTGWLQLRKDFRFSECR